MNELAWINGKCCPLNEATVSVQDRGLLLGEGLFETMAWINGHLWKKEFHLLRMQEGLNGLGIEVPDLPGLFSDIQEAFRAKYTLAHGVFRLTITNGAGGRGMVGLKDAPPTVLATLQPVEPFRTEPLNAVKVAMTLDPSDPSRRWKTTSYQTYRSALQLAQQAGGNEALIGNRHSYPTSFSSGNLLVWDGHSFFTPEPNSGALPGTTLAWMKSVLPENLSIKEQSFSWEALANMNGIYRVSTIKGIVPIDRWGERTFASSTLNVFQELKHILRSALVNEVGAFEGKDMLPWLQDLTSA